MKSKTTIYGIGTAIFLVAALFMGLLGSSGFIGSEQFIWGVPLFFMGLIASTGFMKSTSNFLLKIIAAMAFLYFIYTLSVVGFSLSASA